VIRSFPLVHLHVAFFFLSPLVTPFFSSGVPAVVSFLEEGKSTHSLLSRLNLSIKSTILTESRVVSLSSAHTRQNFFLRIRVVGNNSFPMDYYYGGTPDPSSPLSTMSSFRPVQNDKGQPHS